ncbi:DNA (cytosine-5)-methyltransferase 1B-like [Dorcoceras hygrometricum]|uniref:DNA (Cytosine-5)-methyltransferase 1B-like n=1 Tax=Dorcoceras hygrometricum TaxID=472368 RepID=A0A2Z7A2T4_9LAMI|nr:DNA (cytosine-5)-methyltransferase 1B-like [Dorcoceras hygrometricum]
MAVCTKTCSEDTVTSQYYIPFIELSSDEEEGLHGEARACGRKTKLGNTTLLSPVAAEKVKRLKLCKVTTTPPTTTEVQTVPHKVKMQGPMAPVIIDISDDSLD